MKITVQSIIDHAVTLALFDGKTTSIENLPGPVLQWKNEQFSLIYTTPISGAVFTPGLVQNSIDIWHLGEKCFSWQFTDKYDIDPARYKTADWARCFLAIPIASTYRDSRVQDVIEDFVNTDPRLEFSRRLH